MCHRKIDGSNPTVSGDDLTLAADSGAFGVAAGLAKSCGSNRAAGDSPKETPSHRRAIFFWGLRPYFALTAHIIYMTTKSAAKVFMTPTGTGGHIVDGFTGQIDDVATALHSVGFGSSPEGLVSHTALNEIVVGLSRLGCDVLVNR